VVQNARPNGPKRAIFLHVLFVHLLTVLTPERLDVPPSGQHWRTTFYDRLNGPKAQAKVMILLLTKAFFN